MFASDVGFRFLDPPSPGNGEEIRFNERDSVFSNSNVKMDACHTPVIRSRETGYQEEEVEFGRVRFFLSIAAGCNLGERHGWIEKIKFLFLFFCCKFEARGTLRRNFCANI